MYFVMYSITLHNESKKDYFFSDLNYKIIRNNPKHDF